jgi:hypothetical protein
VQAWSLPLPPATDIKNDDAGTSPAARGSHVAQAALVQAAASQAEVLQAEVLQAEVLQAEVLQAEVLQAEVSREGRRGGLALPPREGAEARPGVLAALQEALPRMTWPGRARPSTYSR